MKKEDYEGCYYIARTPKRLAEHNARSWFHIEILSGKSTGGQMRFNDIVAAVEAHEHGTKTKIHPHQFVTYCIRNGWLKKTFS